MQVVYLGLLQVWAIKK